MADPMPPPQQRALRPGRVTAPRGRCIIRTVERGLPSGTVTFLFSDVEGSTKLLQALGTESYMRVINDHRRVMRDACQPRGGVEVGTEGDSFFVAFPTAEGALDAAREMTARFSDGPIHIRIGLHTGHPHVSDEGYFGIDIHLAARIAAAGHGGQVLVSGATAAAVGTDGLRDLGEHRLKDFDQPVAIYQVGDERFAPLKTISAALSKANRQPVYACAEQFPGSVMVSTSAQRPFLTSASARSNVGFTSFGLSIGPSP